VVPAGGARTLSLRHAGRGGHPRPRPLPRHRWVNPLHLQAWLVAHTSPLNSTSPSPSPHPPTAPTHPPHRTHPNDRSHTPTGAGGPAAQIPWYDHAKFEYYAPIRALFGVQMLLFAWVEMRRLQDIRSPGSAGQDPIFTQYRWGVGGLGHALSNPASGMVWLLCRRKGWWWSLWFCRRQLRPLVPRSC